MTTGVWPGEKASDPQRAPLTTIDLVDAWPEIAGAIGSPDLALARRALVALVITARDEDVFERLGTRGHGALTFLVVEGVVLKVTSFADRSALELLGAGDVLAPPLTAARQMESPALSRYSSGRVRNNVASRRPSEEPRIAQNHIRHRSGWPCERAQPGCGNAHNH